MGITPRQIQLTGGGLFAGNPITYAIDALNLRSRPSIDLSKVSFHRVVMLVTIDGTRYELSRSVTQEPADTSVAENVEFDVSSAFISAAKARQQYAPVTGDESEFNIYRATIQAYDSWLEDGNLQDEQGWSEMVTHDAIAGAYTDYERLHESLTATSSLKPPTGEMVMAGDTYVHGELYDGTKIQPKSIAENIGNDKAGKTVKIGNHDVYVCADAAGIDTAIFQFVNSRGVIESIRAFFLQSEGVEGGDTETVVKSLPETFTTFSRRTLNKKAVAMSLSLSSGFVSEDWARWWVYEFCQSRYHWMLMPDGIWLPVLIKMDSKTSVINRTKSELHSVQFTVTPDINGAFL